MKTWIVERDLNDACERVADAARKAGRPVLRWTDGDRLRHAENAIFLGSLGACASMPGVVGDPESLLVSAWLPTVRDIALNASPVFSTVRQVAVLDLPWPRVFARPDSCMKPFAGRVVDKLSAESLDHGFYYEDLDLPVVLAEAVDIVAEWRFVAVDRQLVAHSGYEADGRASRDIAVPDAAWSLAQVAANRSPEPTVVIDICQRADGGIRLVEYNLFSGADLYACDADAIVQAFG